MIGLIRPRTDLGRALSRHRGLLAGGLAAGAMAAALGVLAPHAEAGVPVLRAARDLPAGQQLTQADLVPAAVPRALQPVGALSRPAEAVGRLLAGPVRAGEALTDVRLVGESLVAAAAPGLLAVPIRLADAASVALLHAGDHVDVLAASTAVNAPLYAPVVAADELVLAAPSRGSSDSGDVSGAGSGIDGGALVVLAVPAPVAARLAAAAVSSRLSVALRGD